MLAEPTVDAMNHYLGLVVGFTDWGVPQEVAMPRFMELDEWSWYGGCAGVGQH